MIQFTSVRRKFKGIFVGNVDFFVSRRNPKFVAKSVQNLGRRVHIVGTATNT